MEMPLMHQYQTTRNDSLNIQQPLTHANDQSANNQLVYQGVSYKSSHLPIIVEGRELSKPTNHNIQYANRGLERFNRNPPVVGAAYPVRGPIPPNHTTVTPRRNNYFHTQHAARNLPQPHQLGQVTQHSHPQRHHLQHQTAHQTAPVQSVEYHKPNPIRQVPANMQQPVSQQQIYSNLQLSSTPVSGIPPNSVYVDRTVIPTDQNRNFENKQYYQQYQQSVQPPLQQLSHDVRQQVQPQSLQEQQQRISYQTQCVTASADDYYPYHKELLNATTALPPDEYTVKMPGGVIHQYPAPDYINPPPQYADVSSNNFSQKDGRNNKQYTNNLYLAEVQQQDTPQAVYQNQDQNLTSPHFVAPLNRTSHTPDSKDRNSSQSLPKEVSPGYSAYRTNVVESPQGSPLNHPQTSPGVFKTPQATPPPERRNPPSRQVSAGQVSGGDFYSLDSPSNQLYIQDMSLNSPRPRSDTVDMDNPPPLPPRSPVAGSRDSNILSSDAPVLNKEILSQKVLPPVARNATPVTQYATDQQLIQTPVNRGRSGTVEMVDSSNPGYNQKLEARQSMPPPSMTQLSVSQSGPQRSRAGTIEMVDSQQTNFVVDNNCTQGLPQQRLRSGTVEMSDIPQQTSYAPPLQPTLSPAMQQSSRSGTPQPAPVVQLQHSGQIVNNTSVYQPVTYDKSSVSKPPPTYEVATAKNKEEVENNAQAKTVNTPTDQNQRYLQQNTVSVSSPQANQNQPQTSQANVAVLNQGVVGPATNGNQYIASNKNSCNNLTYNSQQQVVSDDAVYRKQKIQNTLNETENQIETNKNISKSIKTESVLNDEIPASVVDAYLQVCNNSETNRDYQQPPPPSQTQQLSHQPGTTSYKQEPVLQYKQDSVLQHYNEAELTRQQKIMQQQYLQRVRQAHLQQQLREIQSEYEANLKIEQDVAQEFLQQQELNNVKREVSTPVQGQQIVNTHLQGQQIINTPPHGQQIISTPPRGRLIPTNPLQGHQIVNKAYNMRPQEFSLRQGNIPLPTENMDNTKLVGQRPPPHYVHPQQNAVRGQYLPNMAMSSQYMPPKEMVPANVPYVSRNGAIYPATAMPPGPGMYQSTSKYPNQTRQQPIVIMPGGGSFSNPGQFVPQPGNVSTRKEMLPSGSSTVKQVGNNKEQTPFQKLRKIAEDISTFVDDVVKFKGKKGRLLLCT